MSRSDECPTEQEAAEVLAQMPYSEALVQERHHPKTKAALRPSTKELEYLSPLIRALIKDNVILAIGLTYAEQAATHLHAMVENLTGWTSAKLEKENLKMREKSREQKQEIKNLLARVVEMIKQAASLECREEVIKHATEKLPVLLAQVGWLSAKHVKESLKLQKESQEQKEIENLLAGVQEIENFARAVIEADVCEGVITHLKAKVERMRECFTKEREQFRNSTMVLRH